jgi:hypothetical protein
MHVDEDEYESVLIDAHAARDKKSAGGEPADWEWKGLFGLYCEPSLCAHVMKTCATRRLCVRERLELGRSGTYARD